MRDATVDRSCWPCSSPRRRGLSAQEEPPGRIRALSRPASGSTAARSRSCSGAIGCASTTGRPRARTWRSSTSTPTAPSASSSRGLPTTRTTSGAGGTTASSSRSRPTGSSTSTRGKGYFFAHRLAGAVRLHRLRLRALRPEAWDLTRVGRAVYQDPYVAMDEYVARLVPDWESVPYALDFISYDVGETHDYPRFLCYDCHGFQSYASWNPYTYACTSFRVVIWDDPYFYPAYRYRGTRVVFAQPAARDGPVRVQGAGTGRGMEPGRPYAPASAAGRRRGVPGALRGRTRDARVRASAPQGRAERPAPRRPRRGPGRRRTRRSPGRGGPRARHGALRPTARRDHALRALRRAAGEGERAALDDEPGDAAHPRGDADPR